MYSTTPADWESGVSEPPLGKGSSNNEQLEFLLKETILGFPNLLAHSHHVERAVKLTTEISLTVYEQESRYKHIITKS